MSLPLPPASRTRLHLRQIAVEGWKRSDGLWDTEGLNPDVKPFQLDRCHALDCGSDTVRRYYPRWHRGET